MYRVVQPSDVDITKKKKQKVLFSNIIMCSVKLFLTLTRVINIKIN